MDGAADDVSELLEYIVREKDTLAGIALRHDMTLGDIIKLNRLTSKAVWPGEKLKVRRSRSRTTVDSSCVDSQNVVNPSMRAAENAGLLPNTAANREGLPGASGASGHEGPIAGASMVASAVGVSRGGGLEQSVAIPLAGESAQVYTEHVAYVPEAVQRVWRCIETLPLSPVDYVVFARKIAT